MPRACAPPLRLVRDASARRIGARRCRRALAGLALGAWLVLAAGPAPAAERPVRLGIYHPAPRLCLADEPSQRDLRVLRLAYGVNLEPGQRLDWPWFYRPLPARAGALRPLALDTEALWGRSRVRVLGAQPLFPQQDTADRLRPWRELVLARLPEAGAPRQASVAQLVAPAAAADPFFPSRLAGSRLLPFDLGRNGTRPEELCRRWPAGVKLLPGDERLAYRLESERAGPGPPFQLFAYRERRDLWRAYFGGRLDALLLEAGDFDGQLERYRASQLGPWGVMLGTQQVVLSFQPGLARRLDGQERRALSLALPRAQLAQVDGPGRFAPATAWLATVQAPGALPPAEALQWDTLRARRTWLEHPPELGELRLAVLEHPVLERLAHRMQAQWNKTLNLTLRVEVWPYDQFQRLRAEGAAELVLDVVDLDDGSLQDLWLHSLAALHAPLDGGPQRWEAALRAGLPYLPVIDNVHAVLLRRGAPDDLLRRVCPGCVPAESPRRLAPEPVEREDPQG